MEISKEDGDGEEADVDGVADIVAQQLDELASEDPEVQRDQRSVVEDLAVWGRGSSTQPD